MDGFIEKAHKIKRRYFINTPGGEPYLERLVLEKGKKYLHTIYSSDGDRDPHDHPWDWSSRIIFGSYREHRFDSAGKFTEYKDFHEGDVNKHKAHELHRLELLSPVVVSIVTLGPRIRDWGFQTSKGWVQHEDYLRVKDVPCE